VRGERWEDGTPGVVFGRHSSARSRSSPHGSPKSGSGGSEKETGSTRIDDSGQHHNSATASRVEATHEITEGERYDIDLQIDTIDRNPTEKVAYYAWCTDAGGETVILTVFEDNRPEINLTESVWYGFEDLKGERWDDGTPGVVFRPNSSVTHRDEQSVDETTNDWSKAEELMIDAISLSDDDPYGSGGWTGLPQWSVVPISGAVTGLAVGASFFAETLSPIESGLVILVGVGFAMVSTYFTQYTQLSSIQRGQERKHAEAILEMLKQDYFELTQSDAQIRASVMKPKKGTPFINPNQISIFASSGEHKQSELNLTYNLSGPQGPWCRAYVNDGIETYDTNDKRGSLYDLAPQQEEIISIRSGLSIPITDRNGRSRQTKAVLNLESTDSLEESGFDEEEIQSVIYRYTELLSGVVK